MKGKWGAAAVYCLAAVGGFAAQPLPAQAEQSYHGAICQQITGTVGHDVLGTFNSSGSSTSSVTCPTPIDHNIGNPTWTVRVTDLFTQEGFSCFGTMLDANGDVIVTTPACTTSAAFTGTTTITCTATSGGYATTFSHQLACIIPTKSGGGSSSIKRITLN